MAKTPSFTIRVTKAEAEILAKLLEVVGLAAYVHEACRNRDSYWRSVKSLRVRFNKALELANFDFED